MKQTVAALGVRPVGPVALLLLSFWLLPSSLLAQGTRADYQRAAGLARSTQNKVLNLRLEPGWLSDNRHFWYRRELPGGAWEFVLVDTEQGVKQPAFDHARLATALAKARGKEIAATRLPISRLEFATNRLSFKFLNEGKRWNCDLGSYELTEDKGAGASLTARTGEDAPRATRRNGAETGLTFVNQTANEVELFWLDADGRRQSYGKLRPGEQREQHTFAGHVWLVADGDGGTVAVFEADEGGGLAEITGRPGARSGRTRPAPAKPPGQSPDGQWTAFVRNHNLFLRAKGDGKEQQLSFDGNSDDSYSEEVKWSPDSKKLVSLRTLKGAEHKVYLVESSPTDQFQPKLHTLDYLKPGDRVALSKPQLFDVATRRQIPVSDTLFPNPYELGSLRWEPDSRRFTFVYNQRGHQVLRVVAVDAETGTATPIVDEQSPTFIDYAHKQFTHYLDETRELIWMSERDGWCHLYLYDIATGRVKNQVTRGEWVVRSVIRVDEKKRQIWFRAGGIRSGEDPYYLHVCRINLDGSGLVILTEGDGSHTATLSPERAAFVDTWSRVDQPPVHQLRRLDDGKLLCELERGDAGELLKSGWRAPERFVAKARDGVTDIYGVIIRPTNFDPNQKYPVIEQIYAGPQGAFVPKDFRPFYGMQELAELGFIVVQMDGMGTSYRSKKFHDVCAKNLGDAGFPDRILWIKAAAAKYPYMDLSRVGIYGGSAGGQNSTGALLTHGDFYKVGVSDCGCHDNRMDKIWWNELWMGWPIGPHYEQQSNVTLAKNLQGKLMLLVGELDRNVDPASTMQVANALIKADKDFDLVIIPGAGHGSAESPYGKRRRADFFVRHLLGVEPRSR